MEEIDFKAANLLKKIGDPVRYSILLLLSQREMTPTELASVLGKSQENISQHLGVLRSIDAVRYRTKGTSVYYRVKVHEFLELMKVARLCVEVGMARR